jgi:hypothetical protein
MEAQFEDGDRGQQLQAINEGIRMDAVLAVGAAGEASRTGLLVHGQFVLQRPRRWPKGHGTVRAVGAQLAPANS